MTKKTLTLSIDNKVYEQLQKFKRRIQNLTHLIELNNI